MVIQAYHGTDAKFAPEELDISDKAYLTDNQDLASSFGENVLHLEVEASNPYEINWMCCSWGGGFFPDDEEMFEDFLDFASDGDEEEREYWEENGMCVDMFASYLSDKGYDLFVLHDVQEEHGYSETEYVAMKGCVVRDAEKVLDDVIREAEQAVPEGIPSQSRNDYER